MNSICPMNFFRTSDTTDTTIWKPGFSRTIVNNISEVYTWLWLKSLPGGLGLEKYSRVLENRGFVTLSSLKHLRPGDIDAFFPSPEKLLLAEKHVLESEIKGLIDPESRIISLWPQELSQRFNSYSDTWENYYASSSSYQTAPWKSVIVAVHFTDNNSCL